MERPWIALLHLTTQYDNLKLHVVLRLESEREKWTVSTEGGSSVCFTDQELRRMCPGF